MEMIYFLKKTQELLIIFLELYVKNLKKYFDEVLHYEKENKLNAQQKRIRRCQILQKKAIQIYFDEILDKFNQGKRMFTFTPWTIVEFIAHYEKGNITSFAENLIHKITLPMKAKEYLFFFYGTQYELIKGLQKK